MREALIRRGLLCVLFVEMLACGSPLPPSSSVLGNWESTELAGHSDSLGMHLQQDGSQIQGVACYAEGPYIIFTGVPVRVDYPNVSFVVPGSGTTFVGAFTSGGAIHGYLRFYGSGPPNALTFYRSLVADPNVNYCPSTATK
jgi:hypothetical protein